MNDNLAQKAITFALKGDWDEAITTNKQILQSFPNNIDALNRLAKAYSEVGKLSQAKTYAKKVIKHDPYNSIATKCLEKWKDLSSSKINKTITTPVDAYIEEPGKTRIVKLLHVSSQKLLAYLDCGDKLKLNPHGHRVSVVGGDNGKYIGRLPDNVGSRLKQLIKMGKEYDVYIKSINKEGVKIFIKETYSPKKYMDIQSFPIEKLEYVSFTSPDLVHKKSPMSRSYEQDD